MAERWAYHTRLHRRDSPNLIWNVVNGFSTLSHTLDNADWVRNPNARVGLNADKLAEFFFAQFAVLGPVLFLAFIATAVTRWRDGMTVRLLLVFSLPILLIVCLQALLNQAYANWAVATYIAGIILAVVWLLSRHRAWLIASFAINGLLCVILPLATLMPELTLRGEQLLARYTGRADMSEAIVTLAREAEVDHVVASYRDILADLFYTGRMPG